MDLHGRPVLSHVLERAQQIRGVDRVVLALSSADMTTPLGAWARQRQPFYAMSPAPNDVLGRFMLAATALDADVIMRLTGDCPMLNPRVCEQVLQLYHVAYCDYAWTNTHNGDWPDGWDCEVFSYQALTQAHACAKDAADREHVGSYMRREMRVAALRPDPRYRGMAKMSIDNEEDLCRVRALIGSSARTA